MVAGVFSVGLKIKARCRYGKVRWRWGEIVFSGIRIPVLIIQDPLFWSVFLQSWVHSLGWLGEPQAQNNGGSGGMPQLGHGEAHGGVYGGFPGLLLPAFLKAQQLVGTPGAPRAYTAALVRPRGE